MDSRLLVRWFLSLEAALYLGAALLHTGVFGASHVHGKARIAETVIALVLLAGLAATAMAPAAIRRIALAVQGFALAGTLVGIFTILIGIGPRTVLDLTLHAVMVALLIVGLLAVGRRRVAAV